MLARPCSLILSRAQTLTIVSILCSASCQGVPDVPVSSYWSCQTASLGSGDISLIFFFSCKVTHLPFAVHKKCMVWIRNQWNISWDHVYIICSSNSFCIWLPLMPMWWLENGDFLSIYSKCISWHSPLCFVFFFVLAISMDSLVMQMHFIDVIPFQPGTCSDMFPAILMHFLT